MERRRKRIVRKFAFQPFTEKQMKVLTWWSDSSPVQDYSGIICDGAIRSGKTLVMSLSYVLWAMHAFNGCCFGMCGKTIASFRRNVLSFLLQLLEEQGYSVIYRRSENCITVQRGSVSNDFYVFGGKDESSQDLIQGMTLAGCLFDEVALMPQSFVNQATARCSVSGSKFWFNCNPDNPHHWFYQEWILPEKRREKRILYLHFTMEDNASLTEEVKARYRSMYAGVFYARYILGEWKVAEGLIYDMFDESRHCIPLPPESELQGSAYISVDYGTLNPTVFLMWRKYHGKWLCTKEYYYSGRENHKQRTDAEYADEMMAFIGDTPYTCVVVDPSAASFITELQRRGLKVLKADNAVLDGIRTVCTLLQRADLLFSKDCTRTIAEFYAYRWYDKAAEAGRDEPVKQDDHAMDAMRYFVSTALGRIVTRRT